MTEFLDTWAVLSVTTKAVLVITAWWLTAVAVAVPLGWWIHNGARGRS